MDAAVFGRMADSNRQPLSQTDLADILQVCYWTSEFWRYLFGRVLDLLGCQKAWGLISH